MDHDKTSIPIQFILCPSILHGYCYSLVMQYVKNFHLDIVCVSHKMGSAKPEQLAVIKFLLEGEKLVTIFQWLKAHFCNECMAH